MQFSLDTNSKAPNIRVNKKNVASHSIGIVNAPSTMNTIPYILFLIKSLLNIVFLLLTLPLEVLMDHYWPKSYAKRIPEFTEHVLEYYEKWQNDELDMDKLKEDLWVYGGVRLEEVEGK